MTPLGGLAFAMARRRPWPTFVTVAGGPLVNVIICLICAVGIWLMNKHVFITPGGMIRNRPLVESWVSVHSYLYYFYAVSMALLLFNILPVFPLDGGQLLQAILWKPLGYFRSMMITLNVGLVGSILMIMTGLAVLATGGFAGGAGCGVDCAFEETTEQRRRTAPATQADMEMRKAAEHLSGCRSFTQGTSWEHTHSIAPCGAKYSLRMRFPLGFVCGGRGRE